MNYFEKIPFEEYFAFFKTEATLGSEFEQWIRIQYDYLKEPSYAGSLMYELYSPNNFSILKGSSFVIPTGFRYVGERSGAHAVFCISDAMIENISDEDAAKHIIIRGTSNQNHCFQVGDRLIKLIFEE